jgi:RNA polymerase sigma-70 factor (ECF subfamily)
MSRLEDLAESSDRELLSAHCTGDEDAFGELFRRHRDRMWALALRTTRDPELAADAVQEAFISAFRRADSFRGDAAVTTWLHRIVVNACLDRLRRVKRTATLPDADLSVLADPHDHHHSVEVRLDVTAALDQLPEGQRMALVLVDMHGLSVAEAAAVMDVAEGTIKSRCARGRSAMAQLLGLLRTDQPDVGPAHERPVTRTATSSVTRSMTSPDTAAVPPPTATPKEPMASP